MYFSTWGTLFFIEIRKVLIIKGNKKEQSVDYFPIIITILMMIVCLVDMLRLGFLKCAWLGIDV